LISGTTNDDGGSGRNSRLSYTPTTTGTYYIAAGGYGRNTGSYSFSISKTGLLDDYSANTNTTGSLSIGSSTTGNIEIAGDLDWFAVSLTADTIYQINLEGSPTSAGTLSDPYLRGIYNSSGVLISGTTNDDGGNGRNSKLSYTPTSTGTYYIATGGYQNEKGSYKLSIANQTPASVPNSGFNIEFTLQGDAQYQTYLDQSKSFWENVITENLPTVMDSAHGIIDDILIEVSIKFIDGAGPILGGACPTDYRNNGSGLPYKAIINLDEYEIERLRTSGKLLDVINHEVAHCLGFGRWTRYNLSNGEYQYYGSNALNEYKNLANNQIISYVSLYKILLLHLCMSIYLYLS